MIHPLTNRIPGYSTPRRRFTPLKLRRHGSPLFREFCRKAIRRGGPIQFLRKAMEQEDSAS